MSSAFSGRPGIQQRVLPNYRAPFFDLLAQSCAKGMSLFAGTPRATEGIAAANDLLHARYFPARNVHILDGSFYLCYQRGWKNWLEEWDPDIAILEANPRYLTTPMIVKWMRSRGRKIIGWGLGFSSTSGPRCARALFLNQFDALVAYSQRGAEQYAALGFPREKIFVAHNSVSLPPAFPLPARSSTFDVQPRVLFVGRLQARKRLDHLLRACAEMESKPRLTIVGDGPQRANLERLAEQTYPSARFVGAKHGEELKPYFIEADLFVLPGTGGLAAQEAMSYGLPLIVAKGDGTQDDLVRESNGWQIPPDDYSALASAMRNALSDANRLRTMGAESYRIVREEINLEKMVGAFIHALTVTSKQ